MSVTRRFRLASWAGLGRSRVGRGRCCGEEELGWERVGRLVVGGVVVVGKRMEVLERRRERRRIKEGGVGGASSAACFGAVGAEVWWV